MYNITTFIKNDSSIKWQISTMLKLQKCLHQPNTIWVHKEKI